MIDVVQALELFEICADEMAIEDAKGPGDLGGADRRRKTLTARALAKGQLDVAQVHRFPLRSARGDARSQEPTMTLGAMIVFRTAYRFGRAGASTTYTIDALYRAVQRYVEMIPSPLQDGIDKTAISVLLGDAGQQDPFGRPARSSTAVGCGSRSPASDRSCAGATRVRRARRNARLLVDGKHLETQPKGST